MRRDTHQLPDSHGRGGHRKPSVLGAITLSCLIVVEAAVAQTVVVQPAPIDDPLPNPYKGIAPYADAFFADPAVPQTLFYDDVTWRAIEPDAPDTFRWEALEDDWGPHLSMGRRVGFRFKVADPWSGDPVDIPQWLVERGVALRDYEIDGGTGKAPDWDDTAFLDQHDRIIGALGERYNDDPRVAWIDVGTYGIWGEWHVYGNPHLAGTEATKTRILDAYLRAFPDTPLVIPFDDDFATAYMAERGQGVRNDCLGPLDDNEWYTESLNRISPDLIPEQFKRGIIGGEFCGSADGAIDSMTNRADATLAFIEATHWTFVGPAGAVLLQSDGELLENAKALHKRLGYRFRVETLRYPSTTMVAREFVLEATLVNEGSAPFYYPWETVVSFLNGAGESVFEAPLLDPAWDPRNWTPGSHALTASVRLPDTASLPTGEYTLAVAIRNPKSDEEPLFLAMEGRDDAGRYRMGRLRIATATPWDVNGDGAVDIIDLVTVASAFGTSGDDLPGDTNGDAIVNIIDLVTVASHFGETTTVAGAPQLPHPSHSVLIEGWLRQARRADDGSGTFRRGIRVLKRLLGDDTADRMRLLPNYPNPFNPETWIPFELSKGGEVVVTVYNVRGQVVRSMELGFRDPGVYRTPNRAAYWDGRNDLGEEVAGDAYFVELSTGGYRETRRLALIK